MKWTRFFLLLILVPQFIYAVYDFEDYKKDTKGMSVEWQEHNKLVAQFDRLSLNEKEKNINLLHESIACCRRAVNCCEHILKEINKKNHQDRKAWKKEKSLAEENKNTITAEIDILQRLINNTLQEISFSKAVSFYQESEKKGSLASVKSQNCIRRLNNINEVVNVLHEVKNLYEEALALASHALDLISPYSDEEGKNILKKAIETYAIAADKYRKEAENWPSLAAEQKSSLKERAEVLLEDSRLFMGKGLKASAYELQKQVIPILEELIESSSGQEAEAFLLEVDQIKAQVGAFENEADRSRLTELPSLSNEDFMAREKERRRLFFKNTPGLFFQNICYAQSRPYALALDGSIAQKNGTFTIYAEQFYRFLVQSDTPIPELCITVCKQNQIVHEEVIVLPSINSLSWDRYLVEDGMVFIPETKLKTDFGLDLRLSFFYDPRCNFSMIIAQKGGLQDYEFSFSLKDSKTLYACNFLLAPPWQLECLRKPSLSNADRPIDKKKLDLSPVLQSESGRELGISFPILDEFVEQLKKDPLALAAYVYNEIALEHQLSYEGRDFVYARGVQRNACMTFLEKQGSAWELCQLLVYLLRQAGYPSFYVTDTICSLPKNFLEKMLLTKLPGEFSQGLVDYPWVVFFDGKEWVSLFPWMKEVQVREGYDLYNLMPEEYASADRWILRYLKEDERIFRHMGPDKDDTLGVLFVRFVEEELRKQGLSLSDVGLYGIQVKKQFSSWSDFLRPVVWGTPKILGILDKESSIFSKAKVDIFSRQNPHKKISQEFSLVDLNCSSISLRFSQEGLQALMIGEKQERLLELDESDQVIDITVFHHNAAGPCSSHATNTISMDKGTEAALCFHLGGSSSEVTSQYYEQFSAEQEETKRLHALLAFVGASYFERCGRAEKILAELHKTSPLMIFAFGLAKLSTSQDIKAPQVDMMWSLSPMPSLQSTSWQQEFYAALRALQLLITVDFSSNEHQVLLDVLGVKEAISTVKLLQLANREQQKKGLPEPGFLSLTPSRIAAVENTPEAAKSLYFPYLEDLDLRSTQNQCFRQWEIAKKMFSQGNGFDPYAYAYMTPGFIFSQDRSYREMGSLIFHPLKQASLISSNVFWLHGGLGSPLPSDYFIPSAISGWQLIPISNSNSYGLYVPPPLNSHPNIASMLPEKSSVSQGTNTWNSDVRSEHKSFLSHVGDPVDVVTGAFYIDEVDLVLPGPFPLEIRRNYNSQNPLVGDLGVGWKLSLNPFLIRQDEKLYAAEADGTVIAYRYNQDTLRWEAFPEDNPELYNLNQNGIGSVFNPFHGFIQGDILYGADGSKRIFEGGLLKKWINSRGSILEFSYSKGKLSRIESSNGDFCGVLYNHEEKISEIYAKDGRRIYYSYNLQGDLVKVTLPNSAVITYEYDHSHRMIRETKPYGKVLENVYKEGKVQEQRSPMGPRQSMMTTVVFDYQDGMTTVTDAAGGKTTYKIFQKQIYKIVDPLGSETLQSWFIDEKTWFDPVTEKISEWNMPGGSARCLKSSTDKRGLTTYYLYDSRGNPVEMGLNGADLTGSGESILVKKFTYNDQDLCIQEEVLGQKTVTMYDSTFSFLPKRAESYVDGIMTSYIDLEYNSQGLIEKEDRAGSITLWKYDSRGFPYEKIQLTGTDDPDVVTLYSYNYQGQCIKVQSVDSICENVYDIMGNQIESKVLSLSGTLISANYAGYNLNNQLLWRQTANPNNTVYFDYHASGLVKAARQTLNPNAVAYTLYEYDSLGNLVEEVDPLGYTTQREYDALGRVKSETKEGCATYFTYESGGLLETISTASGAKTERLYTTNGLLKKEIFPDGSEDCITYDFLGRPIRETKNGITWEIIYDDSHHRETRINVATKDMETRDFDARGNLIRFTDAAGYTSEKIYDGLNRLKEEISPSGERTVWNYQNDTVFCTIPNGEKKFQRYEGGCIAESKVVDSEGCLLASSHYRYDQETDTQQVWQGDEMTITWINTLGLPIQVQKGNVITRYEYDACGNCIAMRDGDGRVVRQTFDGLRRLIKKELPDGGCVKYVYDQDSNIAEYHLPNGMVWKASYDSMKRKTEEQLQVGNLSSLHWEYTYENGYLKEVKDPMERIRFYLYDLNGRLVQESVDGWQRSFTYDPRGLLLSAQQSAPHSEHSNIERSYDPDGRLILENIYLNSRLIQETKQEWDALGRSLQINGHTRNFTYQNNQLVEIAMQETCLSYAYNRSGSLKQKSTPYGDVNIDYNLSGLPANICAKDMYEETLLWHPSGKLAAHLSPHDYKQFTYTDRGYLQSAGSEQYSFDFGMAGIGIRTQAPDRVVSENGLDPFGKIVMEINEVGSVATAYNLMGEVISQNSKKFQWDPWGRLLKVSDETSLWEASYDALGRRLQTHYTIEEHPQISTTSFYDPEQEFLEIGVQCEGKTFWKIYGPNSCDAIIDETGDSVVLLHNGLGHLVGVISKQGIMDVEQISSYGSQVLPSLPVDLLSYAKTFTWHSQALDPTGLVWMGARYYDPHGGRFLSPDPIGYPVCLDLYAYSAGDPINYMDPDGRFASPVYRPIKATVLNVWNNPRFQGSLQAFGGFLEVSTGTALAPTLFAPLGAAMVIHGADRFSSGIYTTMTGSQTTTLTSQLLQKIGMSQERADYWDNNANFLSTIGGGGLAYKFGKEASALYNYRLPLASSMASSEGWILPKKGGGAFINGRWYVEHALERMAPRTVQVMAELESRFLARAKIASQKLHPKEFHKWCLENAPNPRGVPPSVVEAEIVQPGSTGVRVILNENGHVITVIPGG